jgi:hypothetical protein
MERIFFLRTLPGPFGLRKVTVNPPVSKGPGGVEYKETALSEMLV